MGFVDEAADVVHVAVIGMDVLVGRDVVSVVAAR